MHRIEKDWLRAVYCSMEFLFFQYCLQPGLFNMWQQGKAIGPSERLEPLSTGLHSDICFVIFIVAVMSSFDKYKTLK